MKRLKWFKLGLVGGMTLSIAVASVPRRVTDDTALYQSLSEARVKREQKPDFDADLARLNQIESRYREKLPPYSATQRISGPMKRIAAQKYRRSSNRPQQQPVARN